MGMLGTAYALREIATVLVASEELEPGSGWQYDRLLRRIMTLGDQLTAESLAAAIVEAYRLTYEDTNPTTTMSAVRLAKIPQLSSLVSSWATAAEAAKTVEFDRIRQARSKCLSYAPRYKLHGIDLGRFLDVVARNSENESLKERANRAGQALRDAVMATYAGHDRAGDFGSSGLAIYFPPDFDAWMDDVDHEGYLESNQVQPVQFVTDHSWDNFLAKYLAVTPH